MSARPATFLALLLPVALSVSACKREDMAVQSKSRTWSISRLLPQHRVVQPPVPGTVSPDDGNPEVPQPAKIDDALLARGQQRYEIYCTPCHGRAGDGDGMIVHRGFPHPPSFYDQKVRSLNAAQIYEVINNGYGVMYGYGDRIGPADRWAVIAYVRALQRSRTLPATALSSGDRARLDMAAPR